MFTIKETEKMWCPADRGYCVANKCMAWRWADNTIRAIGTGNPFEIHEGEPEKVNKGYCGLAGKPE